MSNMFDRLQQEIEDRERQEGMSTLDLLELPEELSRIVVALARRGQMPLDELAGEVDVSADALAPLLDALVDKGLVRDFVLGDQRFYRTYFGRRRGRKAHGDIWAALEQRTEDDADE
jgi:predicted ArsR family transcriptional regulator